MTESGNGMEKLENKKSGFDDEAKGTEEKEFRLEEAFEKLEETVWALEQEDVSLEESFQIYQRGMELLKQCNLAIDRVEKKVQVLSENGETYEF